MSVLGNPANPLIRYKIGDVTDQPLVIPKTGFAILSNVAGRHDDLLLTRSGRLIHPSLVDACFEEAGDAVRRYRVHQQRDGSLVVTLELRSPGSSLEHDEYIARLTEITDGYPVQIRVVECIPLTAAGKTPDRNVGFGGDKSVASDSPPAQRVSVPGGLL